MGGKSVARRILEGETQRYPPSRAAESAAPQPADPSGSVADQPGRQRDDAQSSRAGLSRAWLFAVVPIMALAVFMLSPLPSKDAPQVPPARTSAAEPRAKTSSDRLNASAHPPVVASNSASSAPASTRPKAKQAPLVGIASASSSASPTVSVATTAKESSKDLSGSCKRNAQLTEAVRAHCYSPDLQCHISRNTRGAGNRIDVRHPCVCPNKDAIAQLLADYFKPNTCENMIFPVQRRDGGPQ
jgi:hypothetical protein